MRKLLADKAAGTVWRGVAVAAALALTGLAPVASAEDVSGAEPPSAVAGSLDDKNRNDLAVVRNASHGLDELIAYMRTRPDLFPAHAPRHARVLDPVPRQEVLALWARFLDYQLVLDSVVRAQGESTAASDFTAGQAHANEAFRIAWAAFLSRYRHALEFIDLTDSDPSLRIALDEPVAGIGLPAGTYSDFKLRYLHVKIASEFAALSVRNRRLGKEPPLPSLDAAMAADERYLWKAGRGSGLLRTVGNAGQIVQGTSFKLFFPVQKNVSEWMGDTRVLYGNRFLIGTPQIAKMAPHLRPGDVMLVRREWFLSNIGLPGYWPHAAIYLGTPEERRTWFDTPEVHAWVQGQGVADGQADTLLRTRAPRAYEASLAPDEHGDRYRVIEAMSEGVVFTSLAHSAGADSLAVLRPRLSKVDVLQALLQALGYQGRPYDFNFDFRSDETLVCTELVYKSYSPRAGQAGLALPLHSVMGRPVVTANDIAEQFDQNFDKPGQQFDLVWFLDGQQRTGQAEEADLARFRASWRRPKWHIVTQNTPLASK